MPLGQRFDAQKAIEVVLFIANSVADPTFHRVSKLLYFADLKQLEEFGSLILGDNYVAMKHGPVPTCTYDLLKSVRDDKPHPFRRRAKEAFEILDEKRIHPLRPADENQLSTADVESLKYAIEKFGAASFSKLTSKSHDAAWKSADENELIDLEEVARVASGDELADYVRRYGE